MVKSVVEESGGINPHIPEKIYKVRLAGIEERTLTVEKKNQRGDVVLGTDGRPIMEDVERWDWVFGLRQEEGNPESDIRFTHLTSPKISTKSNAYSMVKALLGGKAPELGKEFDTDCLVGCYADAVVKDKDPRKDKTGNIVLASGIKEISANLSSVTPDINIEGLCDIDEPEAPPAPPAPPVKKGRK